MAPQASTGAHRRPLRPRTTGIPLMLEYSSILNTHTPPPPLDIDFNPDFSTLPSPPFHLSHSPTHSQPIIPHSAHMPLTVPHKSPPSLLSLMNHPKMSRKPLVICSGPPILTYLKIILLCHLQNTHNTPFPAHPLLLLAAALSSIIPKESPNRRLDMDLQREIVTVPLHLLKFMGKFPKGRMQKLQAATLCLEGAMFVGRNMEIWCWSNGRTRGLMIHKLWLG